MDKGENALLAMSVRIPQANPSAGSQQGGGDSGSQDKEEEKTTLKVEGPTLAYMMEILRAVATEQVNYLHLEIIYLSEELAKSDDFAKLLNEMASLSDFRNHATIVICRGKAEEVLMAQSVDLTQVQTRMDESSLTLFAAMGTTPWSMLGEVNAALGAGYSDPVAILAAKSSDDAMQQQPESADPGELYAGELPRKGLSQFEFYGTALFDQQKMKGELNAEETQAMQLINGAFESGVFTIPLEDGSSATIIAYSDTNPKTEITLQNGQAEIHIHLALWGSFYIKGEETDLAKMTDASIEKITSSCEEVIQKCQQIGVEPFGFSEIVAARFLTIPQWENSGWREAYLSAPAEVTMELMLQPMGDTLHYAG